MTLIGTYGWGSASKGELSVEKTETIDDPTPIQELLGLDITNVAAGPLVSFAVADGRIGLLGTGRYDNWEYHEPKRVSGIDKAKRVYIGTRHVLVLTEEGFAYRYTSLIIADLTISWGVGDGGRLCNGRSVENTIASPYWIYWFFDETLKQAAAGEEHSMFLTNDGRVYTCGRGPGLGLGTDDSRNIPEKVPLEQTMSLIAAYKSFTSSVSSDGRSIYGWGEFPGILNQTTRSPTRLTEIEGMLGDATVVDVRISEAALYLLSDGRVISVGNNTNGRLCHKSSERDKVSKPIFTDHDHVMSISSGVRGSVVATLNGTIYDCGKEEVIARWNLNETTNLYMSTGTSHDLMVLQTVTQHVSTDVCPLLQPVRCAGSTLCFDNFSFCSSSVQCPPSQPFLCFDAKCGTSAQECYSSNPNSCGNLTRCWDGSCSERCPPTPACPVEYPKRCQSGCQSKDGVCAEDGCGAGYRLCPDGRCIQNGTTESCLHYNGCPLGQIMCPSGGCVGDANDCTCSNSTVRCFDSTCRASCPEAPSQTKVVHANVTVSTAKDTTLTLAYDNSSSNILPCTIKLYKNAKIQKNLRYVSISPVADSVLATLGVSEEGSDRRIISSVFEIRDNVNDGFTLDISCGVVVPSDQLGASGCLATFRSGVVRCLNSNPKSHVGHDGVSLSVMGVSVSSGPLFYLYGTDLPLEKPKSNNATFTFWTLLWVFLIIFGVMIFAYVINWLYAKSKRKEPEAEEFGRSNIMVA
ncbi:hypothetical protein PROFUN_09117 [Planoprotostelium fungivorum]|uniref:Uncharacterized protein n=1 Tax=Planoprotostelium fungivorum TaxID=1890364 RepID=A0A2P6NHY2_9EUKA|nr:hypothetical protein PROFUN_09117 [Planoprotostelium fungivorum]